MVFNVSNCPVKYACVCMCACRKIMLAYPLYLLSPPSIAPWAVLFPATVWMFSCYECTASDSVLVCVTSCARVITVLYECTCNWLAVEMNFLLDNKKSSNLICAASFLRERRCMDIQYMCVVVCVFVCVRAKTEHKWVHDFKSVRLWTVCVFALRFA